MSLTVPERVALLIVAGGILFALAFSLLITGADLGGAVTIGMSIGIAFAIYAGVVYVRRRVEVAAGIDDGEEEYEEDDHHSPTFILRQNDRVSLVTERTPNERTITERAERPGRGGVSERDRAIIRRLHKGGTLSMAALSELFGVSKSTIHSIVHEDNGGSDD